MKNARKGFTLIEIVVAMLLAAFISGITVTIIAISFEAMSQSEGFRSEKIFVDGAYDFLRDDIANAENVELEIGSNIELTGERKKAYWVKGGVLYMETVDDKNKKIEIEIADPKILRKEGYKMQLVAKANVKDRTDENAKYGVLDMKISLLNKDGERVYGKSSSVRVNTMSANDIDIESNPPKEITNPIIYLS